METVSHSQFEGEVLKILTDIYSLILRMTETSPKEVYESWMEPVEQKE